MNTLQREKPVELLLKIRMCFINYGTVLVFYKLNTDVNVSISEMDTHMKLNHIKDIF